MNKRRRTRQSNKYPSFQIECLEPRMVLASISGTVFHDVDGNGAFAGNDIPLAGIQVKLDGVDRRGNTVQLATTTDAAGDYIFDDLIRGTYSIAAEQSAGLIDGDESIGSHGGTIGNDLIADISIRNNDDATGYDFSELSPSTLKGVTYRDLDRDGNFDAGDSALANVTVTLSGTDDRGEVVSEKKFTAADGTYEFAGLRPGTYALAADTPAGLVDGRETLGRFAGNSHSVPENGQAFNDRFDSIQLGSGIEGRNYNFGEFDDNETDGVLADTFTASIVIDGSSADDTFEFIGGAGEHTIILNGQSQTISAAENTQIIFNGYGGTNTAQLTGGPGVDQAELREFSAKFTGTTYQVLIYTTRNTTVQSGGGEDRALFYDTTGDDSFYADPLGATLSGTNYSHSANDFHRVYAYATDGNDQAQLDGSDNNDRYTATESDARIYGNGYYNYTRGFDEVQADAKLGGDDRAYLHDSAGRDIFEARGNQARLFGSTFDNYALGFDRVYAYATDNYDRAYFQDTAGSDYYKVDQHDARMYGDGYYNRAIGFDLHYVYFSPTDGQVDRVAFYDSASDDYIYATGSYFVGIRNNVVHYVYNPDIVLASASAGTDRAYIRSLSYELRTEGDWDPWGTISSGGRS